MLPGKIRFKEVITNAMIGFFHLLQIQHTTGVPVTYTTGVPVTYTTGVPVTYTTGVPVTYIHDWCTCNIHTRLVYL